MGRYTVIKETNDRANNVTLLSYFDRLCEPRMTRRSESRHARTSYGLLRVCVSEPGHAFADRCAAPARRCARVGMHATLHAAHARVLDEPRRRVDAVVGGVDGNGAVVGLPAPWIACDPRGFSRAGARTQDGCSAKVIGMPACTPNCETTALPAPNECGQSTATAGRRKSMVR